ncbi:MAG: hypothetical protein K9W44_14735 [Candidatus Lokiarchaeota archaeon]|nr:hypothetical protein [Candidatus Harpocratesius repetitus]
MVKIWNDFPEFFTSPGRTHTLETLKTWFQNLHQDYHDYYGYFSTNNTVDDGQQKLISLGRFKFIGISRIIVLLLIRKKNSL